MRTGHARQEKPKTSLKRLLALAIPCALCAIALRVFVFGLYVVPTSSMVPTLLKGDYVFAVKYPYGYSGAGSFNNLITTNGRIGGFAPRRGDVVVFMSPANDGSILVKRLIGLPGDRIQMYRSQLYINRVMVPRKQLPAPLAAANDDEPTYDYLDYAEYLPGREAHAIRIIRELEYEETVNNTPEIIVPPHSYFFMGDNRDRSDDSRVSDVGFVPEENLIGRAEITFFSMSENARIWEFSKWSWAVRWHRLFSGIP